MPRHALILLALLTIPMSASAKGHRDAPQPAADGMVTPTVLEPPPAVKAAVQLAATHGRQMWILDRGSAFASDTVVGWLTIDPRVSGPWITTYDGDRIVTVWTGVVDGTRQGIYAVTMDLKANTVAANVPTAVDAAALPAPFPLTTDQIARFNALQNALGASFPHLAATYNPVVLPDGPDFLVYLLPGNTNPDVYPVGGIVEVKVAADGTVGAVRPLSKSIVSLPKPGTGGVPGDTTTYLPLITELGDHPTEGHFYASSAYQIRLLVLCKDTKWLVAGESAAMIDLPE